MGAIFIVGRRLVMTSRAETLNVKRRLRYNPALHLKRVCVALSAQPTKGSDVLGQYFTSAHVSHYVSR